LVKRLRKKESGSSAAAFQTHVYLNSLLDEKNTAVKEKYVQFVMGRIADGRGIYQQCMIAGDSFVQMHFLLGSCGEFAGGGGGALLGSTFLLDVRGAHGDFVIDIFDFASKMKIFGIFRVGREERVSPGFQVVTFFLPGTGNCHHGVNLATSVRSFIVYR
jgi:hypothetical protein